MSLDLPQSLCDAIASQVSQQPTLANRIAGFLEGKGEPTDIRYVLEITGARLVAQKADII